MKKLLVAAVAAGAAVAIAGSASAALLVAPVAITEAGLTGYQSQQIRWTSATDVLAANLVVNLTSGSLYNSQVFDPDIDATAADFESRKALEAGTANDSRLRLGGTTSSAGASDATVPGANGQVAFGPTRIDFNWFDTATNDINTTTGVLLGTLTFSGNANGTFTMRVDAPTPTTVSYAIANGVVQVPEPASLSLLGLGAMGLVARRRRA